MHYLTRHLAQTVALGLVFTGGKGVTLLCKPFATKRNVNILTETVD